MEVLDEKASTVQEQIPAADLNVIQSVKSEILKSIASALRLESTDMNVIQSVKSEILKSIAFTLRLESAPLLEISDLNALPKIDFYKEVEHFEINLIKQALIRMKGNQRAAAKLLNLSASTLNSKIKLYRIEW